MRQSRRATCDLLPATAVNVRVSRNTLSSHPPRSTLRTSGARPPWPSAGTRAVPVEKAKVPNKLPSAPAEKAKVPNKLASAEPRRQKCRTNSPSARAEKAKVPNKLPSARAEKAKVPNKIASARAEKGNVPHKLPVAAAKARMQKRTPATRRESKKCRNELPRPLRPNKRRSVGQSVVNTDQSLLKPAHSSIDIVV